MGFRRIFQKSLVMALAAWCAFPNITMPDPAVANPVYCDARVEKLGGEIHAQMSDLVEIKVGMSNGQSVAKLRLRDLLGTFQYEGVYLQPGRMAAMRGYVTSFDAARGKTERRHVATMIATVDSKQNISWAARLEGKTPTVLSGQGERVMCGTTPELKNLFGEIERQGKDLFEVRDVDVNSPRLLAHLFGTKLN